MLWAVKMAFNGAAPTLSGGDLLAVAFLMSVGVHFTDETDDGNEFNRGCTQIYEDGLDLYSPGGTDGNHSSTSRNLRARSSRVNGFDRNCTPSSSTPRCAITSLV